MKKPLTFQENIRESLAKRLAIVVGVAVLITAIVLSCLWLWFVVPENQRRFDRQVADNIDRYKKQIDQYLIQLEQPLHELMKTIPVELFQPPQEASNNNEHIEQWLLERKSIWKRKLRYIKDIELISIDKIQQEFSPSTTKSSGISFLLIDMINRLRTGQPSLIEVAKVTGTSEWQLHKINPIRNQEGALEGLLHTTFSLQGLRDVFSHVDPSLANIVLTQSIDGELPLAFFTMGNASNDYTQKTSTMTASHWQIAYRPSLQLKEKTEVLPIWFLSVAIIMPLLLLLMGLKLTHQPVVVSKGLLKKKKIKPTNEHKIEVGDDSQDQQQDQQEEGQDQAPLPIDNDTSLVIPDTIFRAYDIRGIAYDPLSHEIIYAIGQAVASEVLAAGDNTMIVGHDARIHSQEFSACVIEGIISTGCDVIDIGLVPTPLMNFTACQHEKTSSGLIITASHNPKEYNGCKIVVKGETLVDDDIQQLKTRIRHSDIIVADTKGKISKDDYSQMYIDRILSDVAVIDGWRVVVDAGNGAASELAPRMFKALQCDVTPLFCEFDGEFPNHNPDPSEPKNLAALVSTVQEKKADIGFAFDGDGDRLMIVTDKGRILWPDQLLMLFAQDIVSRNPGCDVVFDIKSTHALGQLITDNGGRPVISKTGHSHIKAKMKETQALLGGEFSGHIFFKERWFGFDDGLYAAARLLEIMTLTGQTIDNLLSSLPETISTPEIKVAVTEEKKFALIEQLIDDASFDSDGQKITIDGLRVDFEKGWGLVRASNTVPALTLRFEATDEQELERIKQQFARELHKIDKTLVIDF